MREEILEIWRCLFKAEVSYLIVGGFAVNLYGYNRSTGDIDVLLDDTKENRKKLRSAIRESGLGDFGMLETIPFIPGWTDIALDFGFKLDLMSQLNGLEQFSFDDLKKKSTRISIGDFYVDFLDYQSLILTKLACNRPKDRLDIEELVKINNQPLKPGEVE